MDIENEVKEALKQMENKFSSHDFIKKFSSMFQKKYIELLYNYKNENEPFQVVHSQIGRFLERNAQLLEIKKTKTEKSSSENIFGNINDVQEWEKF